MANNAEKRLEDWARGLRRLWYQCQSKAAGISGGPSAVLRGAMRRECEIVKRQQLAMPIVCRKSRRPQKAPAWAQKSVMSSAASGL